MLRRTWSASHPWKKMILWAFGFAVEIVSKWTRVAVLTLVALVALVAKVGKQYGLVAHQRIAPYPLIQKD